MRAALEESGYDVGTLPGAGGPAIGTRIFETAGAVPEGGTLLLCFTGHGVRHGDTDCLVPADAQAPPTVSGRSPASTRSSPPTSADTSRAAAPEPSCGSSMPAARNCPEWRGRSAAASSRGRRAAATTSPTFRSSPEWRRPVCRPPRSSSWPRAPSSPYAPPIYGRPGDEITLGGQALRAWTEREVVRVTRRIVTAAVCCVTGLVPVAAAVAVAWSTTGAAAEHLVRVTTPAATVCGELADAGARGTAVRTGRGGERLLRVIPAASVTSVEPVGSCPGR
ncbi:hypothetical protein ABZ769_30060 [Streptomyces olivoreticuli]